MCPGIDFPEDALNLAALPLVEDCPRVLLLTILLPLLMGTLLTGVSGAWPSGHHRMRTAVLAGLTTAGSLGLLLWHSPSVLAGSSVLQFHEWVPEIGLHIGLRLDGLSLLFALLITGMGLLIVLYAHHYLSASDSVAKFYCTLMLFMAAMLGVVLSDNLLLLLVFWELTSISSFLLVGYWNHRPDARAGARMALAVTGGGGLALLAGFVLLGQIAGTYEISAMAALAPQIQSDARYPVALVLVLLGCFTKSAQFPFHFWLPQAMAAPTPVSAYLHSATMVKAGLFLLARLTPVIGGTELFMGIVSTAGLLTLAFAAFIALFKHDLKGLLAYSTISHLGLITFLIGLGSPLAAVAALFHVLNHACFKAALFMTAGMALHALDGHHGHGGGCRHGGRAAVQRLCIQGDVPDRGRRLCTDRWLALGGSSPGHLRGPVQRGVFGAPGA
jgi:multicomponent K+:H+ antiporter subunit A